MGQDKGKSSTKASKPEVNVTDELARCADLHGMKGRIRRCAIIELSQAFHDHSFRTIFCIVMGSSDYVDALEKLLGLEFTESQNHEVMRCVSDVSCQ